MKHETELKYTIFALVLLFGIFIFQDCTGDRESSKNHKAEVEELEHEIEMAYEEGYNEGYMAGYAEVLFDEAIDEAYSSGYEEGFSDGVEAGYSNCMEDYDLDE